MRAILRQRHVRNRHDMGCRAYFPYRQADHAVLLRIPLGGRSGVVRGPTLVPFPVRRHRTPVLGTEAEHSGLKLLALEILLVRAQEQACPIRYVDGGWADYAITQARIQEPLPAAASVPRVVSRSPSIPEYVAGSAGSAGMFRRNMRRPRFQSASMLPS